MSTLIVYPDPSTGATTTSARVYRSIVDESFVAIQNGAGTAISTSQLYAMIQASSTSNQFQGMYRSIMTYDTSAIAGGTVDSVIFSGWALNLSSGLGSNFDIDVVSATPAADNNIVTSDYSQTGSIKFASRSFSTTINNVYNTYTFNASGSDAINTTGVTGLGLKINWDTDDSFGGVWSSSAFSRVAFRSADTAGTANDPKLTIEYSASVGGADDANFFGCNF